MKRLLASLLLLACAHASPPVPGCRTRCGLRASTDCAALQALEDKAVEAFGALGWGDQDTVCTALNGWTLVQHAQRPSDTAACGEGAWMIAAGFCVRGYTHVRTREVEVMRSTWESSAAAHELVHVLDWTLFGTAGHCNWHARGIKAALQAIQGRPDESGPEVTCP